jgi:hypothetical protein
MIDRWNMFTCNLFEFARTCARLMQHVTDIIHAPRELKRCRDAELLPSNNAPRYHSRAATPTKVFAHTVPLFCPQVLCYANCACGDIRPRCKFISWFRAFQLAFLGG